MVICGNKMFEFSVSKDMGDKKKTKRIKRRIPTYILVYLLASIVNELKISVEQGRVVVTLNVIKH